MRTSPKGLAFLERHEGVVLRAYRDSAGAWTIGTGLTARSGVVTPKYGMMITADEAQRLLGLALARQYEPAVARAMPTARQHEFDGAVSFHFNTGAIGRAGWVRRWRLGDDDGVAAGLDQWVRAGGKVLAGLVARRKAEAALILRGNYGSGPKPVAVPDRHARISGPVADPEAIRRGLIALGYKPGGTPGPILYGAVVAFQRDHDLTPDGVVGRATAATLARALAAGRKTRGTVATGSAGAVASQIPGADALVDPATVLIAAAAFAVVALAITAWRYRDIVAARIGSRAPGLAAILRRI